MENRNQRKGQLSIKRREGEQRKTPRITRAHYAVLGTVVVQMRDTDPVGIILRMHPAR
jgi:hypothetical protein